MPPSTASSPTNCHAEYLEKALRLAEQRKGFCAPNPSVGAILVKENTIIGEGNHLQAGEAHAEVKALSSLTPEKTEGATLYVTLEPCSHVGKTPPCTDLLIQHRLKAVYYAFKDPNPLVSGKGQQKLRDAGIICEQVACEEVKNFYQSYLWWIENQRPWVTAKIALSLDGKIAGPFGVPVSITGEVLYVYTHQCRKHADAILTTARTIINDNPQMNARVEGEIYKKPLYILDSHLNTPVSAQIFDSTARVCLFHLPEASYTKKMFLIERGALCIPVSEKEGRLSLDDVMAYIGGEGIHDVWVEVGGTCFQSLLSEKLLHRILVYVAPKSLGVNALSAFSGDTDIFEGMSQVVWRQFGEDALCEMFPKKSESILGHINANTP